jgi:hypothetical protein
VCTPSGLADAVQCRKQVQSPFNVQGSARSTRRSQVRCCFLVIGSGHCARQLPIRQLCSSSLRSSEITPYFTSYYLRPRLPLPNGAQLPLQVAPYPAPTCPSVPSREVAEVRKENSVTLICYMSSNLPSSSVNMLCWQRPCLIREPGLAQLFSSILGTSVD